MAYSYEQGIIDGDKTQEKFLKNNPTWVDLNKKVLGEAYFSSLENIMQD